MLNKTVLSCHAICIYDMMFVELYMLGSSRYEARLNDIKQE